MLFAATKGVVKQKKTSQNEIQNRVQKEWIGNRHLSQCHAGREIPQLRGRRSEQGLPSFE